MFYLQRLLRKRINCSINDSLENISATKMMKHTLLICRKAMKFNGLSTCLQEEWILRELCKDLKDLNSNDVHQLQLLRLIEITMETNVTNASQNLDHEDNTDHVSQRQQQQSLTLLHQPHHRRHHHEEPHHITVIPWQRSRSSFWFIIFPSQLLSHLFIQHERCHQVIAKFRQHTGSSQIII